MSRFTSLKSFKFLFSLALLLVVSANAFDLTVKANVDNAQVFIGDKFNYEIQVTAPEMRLSIYRALSVTLAALKSRK